MRAASRETKITIQAWHTIQLCPSMENKILCGARIIFVVTYNHVCEGSAFENSCIAKLAAINANDDDLLGSRTILAK